jgi:spore germination cell wall hydrolase CwlJ-like protein
VEIAKYVHGNYGNIQVVDDATYFHATYVDPGWTKLEKIVTIGDHIFYR